MGENEDHIAANHSAPKTPEEWRTIRQGVDKAHKAWVVVGPFHAVVSNWKALAIAVAFVVWVSRPEIIAALRALAGVKGP